MKKWLKERFMRVIMKVKRWNDEMNRKRTQKRMYFDRKMEIIRLKMRSCLFLAYFIIDDSNKI